MNKLQKKQYYPITHNINQELQQKVCNGDEQLYEE